jgi:ubiquinone/menaquinone biosynthesis C-methylase UbiE
MPDIVIGRDNMGTDKGTGWERSSRTVFDEIVTNYDKIRWGYPDELYMDIIRYSESPKGKKALEIGAGTGKATVQFLNMGYDVTAVEMGVHMSEFLLDKFKGYPNFNVVTTTFEDVLLEDTSYNLIYAASAFHWVDAE